MSIYKQKKRLVYHVSFSIDIKIAQSLIYSYLNIYLLFVQCSCELGEYIFILKKCKWNVVSWEGEREKNPIASFNFHFFLISKHLIRGIEQGL